MKIASIGGGPAALYFAILRKKSHPSDDVVIYERNAPLQTFGWGVVFSDDTLSNFEAADKPSHDLIARAFRHWTDIDIFVKGERIRSTGHGFAGMGRRQLLGVLQTRARELGVRMEFERDLDTPEIERIAGDCDLLLGADGVNSKVRKRWESALSPTIDVRKCKYMWLGTELRLTSFTFIFEKTEHGIFQVHAYPFDDKTSTFIVECDEATWRAAGLDAASTDESVAYLEKVFAKYLDGCKLLTNKSLWINFPTIKNERWWTDTKSGALAIMGDAARTAHFSIGSGTKLAMEDSIALAKHLAETPDIRAALRGYEMERKDASARIQKSAQDSLLFFENVKRWYDAQTPLELAFNLLTRSKRITYENLKMRDPDLVAKVRTEFNDKRGFADRDRPPMFAPFSLRGMHLRNRVVVSPMCMYSATDGTPNDFHLVHLGARAMGGAGLVIAEMTDVSAEGRITLGCAGIYADEHAAAWKRIADVRARAFAREDRHPARSRGAQGRNEAPVGGHAGRAARSGRVAAPRRVGHSLSPDEPGPEGDGRGRHGARHRSISRRDEARDRVRVRHDRDPHGARVSPRELPLAAHEPPQGRARRRHRGARALPLGDLRRGARRVAEGQTHDRAHLRGRLGGRRDDRGGLGRALDHAPRPRVRRDQRVDGPDHAEPAADLRAHVADALRRPNPARGEDPDHRGRQHRERRSREHDLGCEPRRSLRHRAPAPRRPELHAPRREGAKRRRLVAGPVLPGKDLEEADVTCGAPMCSTRHLLAFAIAALSVACAASSHPVTPASAALGVPSAETRAVLANMSARVAALCREVKGDAETYALYDKACRGGDRTGCQRAAAQLECGIGVAASTDRAIDMVEAMCQRGDADGCDATAAFALARPKPTAADFQRAAHAYERTCAANPAACDNIGLFYSLGLGVPQDSARAISLLQKACDLKNGNGCYNLAFLAEKSGDLGRVFTLYTKACESGSQEACVNLGMAYEKGRGVRQDLSAAAKLYDQACTKGMALGCNNLGHLYQEGLGLEKDPQKAAALFQKSCNDGVVQACTSYGYCLETGFGVTRDVARATSIYESACERDEPVGCSNLGLVVQRSPSPDLARAARLFKKSCDGGYANACDNLALAHQRGAGVARDIPRAMQLFARACEGGDSYACSNIGSMYYRGTDIPRDLARAYTMFDKACGAGNGLACTNLGMLYVNGEGVPKDMARAVALFTRACDVGDALGCKDLGVVYGQGVGVTQDWAKAIALLGTSCDKGEPTACTALAQILINGDSGTKDPARGQIAIERALSLLTEQCNSGLPDACSTLADLKMRLKDFQPIPKH